MIQKILRNYTFKDHVQFVFVLFFLLPAENKSHAQSSDDNAHDDRNQSSELIEIVPVTKIMNKTIAKIQFRQKKRLKVTFCRWLNQSKISSRESISASMTAETPDADTSIYQ